MLKDLGETPPFCLNRRIPEHLRTQNLSAVERGFTEDEFVGLLMHYSSIYYRQYLSRTGLPLFTNKAESARRKEHKTAPLLWPALWPEIPGLGWKEYLKYGIPFDQMSLAQTAKKQARARKKVKDLSKTAPMPIRTLLAKGRELVPQVKARHSDLDVLEMIRYRAERFVLWEFLEREALAILEMKCATLRRATKDDLDEAVTALLIDYPFLEHRHQPFNLTPKDIKRGIQNPHRAANADIRKKYRRSSKWISSFFSKVFPPLTKLSAVSPQ